MKYQFTFFFLIACFFSNLSYADCSDDIYQRSCRACHENTRTSAPQTGDSKAWEKVLKKGEARLLANVKNGYRAMPPLGACPDCTDQDYIELIYFMATGKDDKIQPVLPNTLGH